MGDVGKSVDDALDLGVIGYIFNEIVIDTYNSQEEDTELGIFNGDTQRLIVHDDDVDYPSDRKTIITIAPNSSDFPPGVYYIAAGKWNTEYKNNNFRVEGETTNTTSSIRVNTRNNDNITSTNSVVFYPGETMIFWLKFTILEKPIVTQTCFRKGSLIKTDQGNLKIENIVTGYNTINNNIIKRVTQSYNSDGVIVKIDKNSLGQNKPENDLYMQKDHKLLISPFEFASLLSTNKISFSNSNNEEILYNVLLDSHETMKVNNIEVETLNPDLLVSKYFMKPSAQLKDKIENNTIKIPIV